MSFHTLPKQFQYEILNAIGTREENSCYLFLIQNLTNEDEEIIIRSLHAISKLMPKAETKEHVKHLFKKDSWQIHLMLIRVISPFKDEMYFPYLLEQAGHQSWWVRVKSNMQFNIIQTGKKNILKLPYITLIVSHVKVH